MSAIGIYRHLPDASRITRAQIEHKVNRDLHAKHLLVVVGERCPRYADFDRAI